MALPKYSSSSAVSSSNSKRQGMLYEYPRTPDDGAQDQVIDGHGYNSFDEFCMLLRDRVGTVDCEVLDAELTSEPTSSASRQKSFSYVSNWRSKVDSANLTIVVPPSPLFHSFDSPSSPVASIDPSRLCVTSIPPSEYENYSPSSMTGRSEYDCEMEPDVIEDSVASDFHGVYDPDFARMFSDDASEVESLSSVSYHPGAFRQAYMSIPQAASPYPNINKSTRFQNVSSAIRWLPTRIKYSILSQAAQRASRKA
ncbi:hypothetical protein FB446DRAFT_849708 [Lentinula raphanica]|nr:hypothetical protein FB446DRAFT_849708 [Lentinula raphanica]